MTIRAVLDANVFISSAIQRGPSHRIVQQWMEREAFTLIVSRKVLEEVAEVLARPRLAKWISAADAVAYVRAIRTLADIADDPDEVGSFTRDPDDDYLIDLARRSEADFIVSGDRDLLEWHEQVPQVVTPAAFEAILR